MLGNSGRELLVGNKMEEIWKKGHIQFPDRRCDTAGKMNGLDRRIVEFQRTGFRNAKSFFTHAGSFANFGTLPSSIRKCKTWQLSLRLRQTDPAVKIQDTEWFRLLVDIL